MRWIAAAAALIIAAGALVLFAGFPIQVEAPVEDGQSETAADTDAAGDAEAADVEPVPGDETETAQSPDPAQAENITAIEDWQFPEPDVVLQGEWYHIDKGCDRLVNDPAPTPMLRQIAVSTGFTPCFLCSRDDAERGPDAGAGIPEALRAGAEAAAQGGTTPEASADQ